MRLAITNIKRDEGQRVRVRINNQTVQQYAERSAAGDEFPAPVVYNDGSAYWLADGFHIVAAHEVNGVTEVECEVRSGTRRDALDYAIGANRRHGLPLTNADKRRAVGLRLDDDEWRTWSDAAIAAHVGVSDRFVAKCRKNAFPGNIEPRKGRDGRVRKAPRRSTPNRSGLRVVGGSDMSGGNATEPDEPEREPVGAAANTEPPAPQSGDSERIQGGATATDIATLARRHVRELVTGMPEQLGLEVLRLAISPTVSGGEFRRAVDLATQLSTVTTRPSTSRTRPEEAKKLRTALNNIIKDHLTDQLQTG